MADEGSAKENEGDKKIVHTYPLVKVCRNSFIQRLQLLFDQLFRSNKTKHCISVVVITGIK